MVRAETNSEHLDKLSPLKRPLALTTPLTESEKQVKMRLDIEAADLGYLLVPQSMYPNEIRLALLPKLTTRSNAMQSVMEAQG